jgi:malonyl CoA-acyl carrier protein transacylase
MLNKIALSFDETVGVIEALQAGRSLRDIGREYGIAHQKVYQIGHTVGVYSVRSFKKSALPETQTVDEFIAEVTAELAAVEVEIAPVRVRHLKVFGNSAYARQRQTGLPWRKVVAMGRR